ncbi:rod-binding protein [Fulvimarina endophytica]|uniref:Rod-binding protein n=1 Tax=Fulvimarina endophytica TaxID=2293836 RepID=A0A371X0A9_9HYPH|nr:rod-binding protein [Fulvimarina endophytica]RFC62639.1 rod-binding protein [Fulvimarina endophytica]
MTIAPIAGTAAVRPEASGKDVGPAPRSSALVKHEVDKLAPAQEFEAFALRSFVEEMLPSEASNFFGGGTAGNIWRSMMAEQLGEQLARDGGIGIADMISADRAMEPQTAAETKAQAGESARTRFGAMLAGIGKP